jgi:hypothetical protein
MDGERQQQQAEGRHQELADCFDTAFDPASDDGHREHYDRELPGDWLKRVRNEAAKRVIEAHRRELLCAAREVQRQVLQHPAGDHGVVGQDEAGNRHLQQAHMPPGGSRSQRFERSRAVALRTAA